MKIRTRITLFVVLSGLTASLLFSVVLLYELLEQPFRILDDSLKEEARRAVRILMQGERPDAFILPDVRIRVEDTDAGKTLYESPSDRDGPKFFDAIRSRPIATLPVGFFADTRRDPRTGTIFRVKTFALTMEGRHFRVQATRSMNKLGEEIREIFLGIAAGLLLTGLVLIFLGRLVARKIVRPVAAIGNLAQEIGAKNLDRRIPTGSERDELSDLAATLNRMFDRLQLSFARQREFLFDTSHELKTPLTTMRLAAEELQAEEGERLSPAAQETLQRLETQVRRMERLVRDLLNLSSMEAREDVETAPVDVGDMLRSLAEEYRIPAEAQRIELAVRVPERLVVCGDAEKLERAFSNLLNNAIRYNVPDGRVLLRAVESPDGLTVVVENTGDGVPEEAIPRVFDPFYRAEKSRSPEKGGSGLGLAIVKKAVELHGGTVRFESDPGGVSRLTVFLPGKIFP